jgi:hypothetical protein
MTSFISTRHRRHVSRFDDAIDADSARDAMWTGRSIAYTTPPRRRRSRGCVVVVADATKRRVDGWTVAREQLARRVRG